MLPPNPPRASITVPLGVRLPLGERASDLGIEWDAENRITAVKEGSNTLASFTYDASGRRATKTAGAVTTTFVYDGAQFLEERPIAGSAKRYVYGAGIDQLLAHTAGGVTSYFFADHLGSVVRLADAGGVPTLTREYDPWGNPLQGSATSGYAFTGREWDSETSLYYYRARYYEPKIGRFLSEDPIGLDSDSPSLATYVMNSPVVRTDPFGLKAGDKYPNKNTAAKQAMKEIYAKSYWQDREYCGAICCCPGGGATYGTAMPGLQGDCSGVSFQCPGGTEMAAFYHSHGRDRGFSADEYFSTDDNFTLLFSKTFKAMYLITPKGVMKKRRKGQTDDRILGVYDKR